MIYIKKLMKYNKIYVHFIEIIKYFEGIYIIATSCRLDCVIVEQQCLFFIWSESLLPVGKEHFSIA